MSRRSNEERRAATRAAVLDATVTAIVEHGYREATSARIAAISGYTRGAQIHHFGTKANLVAAALLHLHDQLLRDALDELEEAARAGLPRFLEVLWGSFRNDLFTAAAELQVAARTDAELREVLLPVEREIGRRITSVVTGLLGRDHHDARRLEDITHHITNTMRGMALQRGLVANPKRERRQLALLEEVVEGLLRRPDPPAR